jgi:16S rRNA (adenine1518-N6/adenine1519-N6)-dimethyltransferase
VKANTGCSLERHSKPSGLYEETLNLLRQHHILPKKRLGQNFTVDESLLQSMVNYADVEANDTILEVGAGLGFLTRLLAPRVKKVLAVELDHNLITILQRRLSSFKNVQIIHSDILTSNIAAFDKVLSTPPYSISSPLLFWLLEREFKSAVMTLQEEFARRLTADVGSKDYSRLTVATYYRADVELLEHVSNDCFYPSPDVDSIIVRVRPKPAPFKVNDEETFNELIKTVFTQRNKKLRNAVMPYLLKRGIPKEKAQKTADALTFHYKRVRELAPEDFGALTNELAEKARSLR